ncbi:TKL protein kinase [Saprolegnia parasitica CBS 223.65]|uniref:TKL protein kinase n=1 Tax=Saprolegnia parasitica (strain CBS 223.65) TaxID=695850 RepID=A0A067CVD4_SAPPC|nr:TKL protein kinase [Saprolegnia parasitica CBS 223.65]KDO34488.1 TKL protein kinase [Saprolegnia parasitica CBS 223.65]|eukprot:XP_012194803.1 TKL protein kinase [Saprolegnia parasitica CBS 223.65]
MLPPWVLGGDRSFRRLVLFYAYSLPTLPLLCFVGFYLWLFWLAFSFVLQLLFAPFERTAGLRGFWRAFLRENVTSGFLEWLCRWEIRARNVYTPKLYIEPTRDVVLEPYLLRVATYFVVWKFIELCVCAGLVVSSTFFFVDAQLRGNLHIVGILYIVLILPVALRLLALAKVSCSTYCLTPVFEPDFAYIALFDEGMLEVVKDRARRRVTPGSDLVDGLSIVAPSNGDNAYYCIPVPTKCANMYPDATIPMLQHSAESLPQLPPQDEAVAMQPPVSVAMRPPESMTTRDSNTPESILPDVLPRVIYVTEPLQAPVPTYDPFTASYQDVPLGAYRSLDVPIHSTQTLPPALRYDDASSIVTYDTLSPTASLSSQQSQSFQLPRVSRAIDDPAISARSSTTIDPVHFSAFCPPVVSTSVFTFSIWAFLVHQRDEMREEATTRNDDGAKQLSREVLMHVRRGARDLSQPLSLVTEQKQQILKGAASGFLNMHEGRFIHRDIAARNCLVDATLNAKVCDFGMCRRVGAVGGSYFAHGTGPLKYMAPESLTPPHAFSYQSDVYSFGVLIWETYHGVSPFAGLSGAEAAARVLSGDRLALSTAIPLHLQDLVTQCFRDDPSKRPSMAQVLMALERR